MILYCSAFDLALVNCSFKPAIKIYCSRFFTAKSSERTQNLIREENDATELEYAFRAHPHTENTTYFQRFFCSAQVGSPNPLFSPPEPQHWQLWWPLLGNVPVSVLTELQQRIADSNTLLKGSFDAHRRTIE